MITMEAKQTAGTIFKNLIVLRRYPDSIRSSSEVDILGGVAFKSLILLISDSLTSRSIIGSV